MQDYSYIHIGRGKIYSDFNQGLDSTIEPSYLNPKFNRVEIGDVNASAIANLQNAVNALTEDMQTNKMNIKTLQSALTALNLADVQGTTIKEKIDSEIDNYFEPIDVQSLNLSWGEEGEE